MELVTLLSMNELDRSAYIVSVIIHCSVLGYMYFLPKLKLCVFLHDVKFCILLRNSPPEGAVTPVDNSGRAFRWFSVILVKTENYLNAEISM